jgi:hypothetical protein
LAFFSFFVKRKAWRQLLENLKITSLKSEKTPVRIKSDGSFAKLFQKASIKARQRSAATIRFSLHTFFSREKITQRKLLH